MTKKDVHVLIDVFSFITGLVLSLVILSQVYMKVEPKVLAWRGHEANGGEDFLYGCIIIFGTYFIYVVMSFIWKKLYDLLYF